MGRPTDSQIPNAELALIELVHGQIQVFEFCGCLWDVDEAKRIVASRERPDEMQKRISEEATNPPRQEES